MTQLQHLVREKQTVLVLSPQVGIDEIDGQKVAEVARLASMIDSVPSFVKLHNKKYRTVPKDTTLALIKMPSGNHYIITDGILRKPRNFELMFGYKDVKRGLMKWALEKRDNTLYYFFYNTPLERISIEHTTNFNPRISSLLGLIVFDYFKIADQLEIYKKMESQLEVLTKKTTSIDTNTQDILRGIDDLKTSMEMLLTTVQTMRDMMLRLSDRLIVVQNLLEKMNTPEAKVAREIINTTIQDINKTQEEVKTSVDNLPSFARDNPWLNILSRGRTQ
jgi:hypothetical protein